MYPYNCIVHSKMLLIAVMLFKEILILLFLREMVDDVDFDKLDFTCDKISTSNIGHSLSFVDVEFTHLYFQLD